MSKYVAFLDILGFKTKLKQLGQAAAQQYISSFSATAYHEWQRLSPRFVEGYIVSDSFVMYTQNTSRGALIELACVINKICKKEFSENKILLRGAIAKGEFERMPAEELANLSKGLMVGQAYVDAYTLESTAKVAGIILTEEVYVDLCELDEQFECTEERAMGGSNYIMRYLDYEYLSKIENMRTYVDLAASSNWLPHYYNTLYFAMKPEKNPKKVASFFENIFRSMGDPSESWGEIDKFIENAFNEDVIANFKKRFLKYIREHIIWRKNPSDNINNRLSSNKDRILDLFTQREELTIPYISSVLRMSRPTVARIIISLIEERQIKELGPDAMLADRNGRSIKTYVLNKD